MKVLLIEPDQVLGSIYVKTLELAGYAVSWATGAQQAVALADATMPDVVVLELQLPGHGGVEFLYEFRSYLEWQKIPILLHTLVDQDSVAIAELGVVRYLYKPATSLRHLVRAVREVVPVSS